MTRADLAPEAVEVAGAAVPRAPVEAYDRFRRALCDAGVLVATGAEGVYLRSSAFEAVVRGIDQLVSAAARDQVDYSLHFPLVMDKRLLARTDYARSFPNLLGAVHGFEGGDAEHAALLESLDEDGGLEGFLEATDLALVPAGCHPLYPSQGGRLPAGGRVVEVFAQCFRREPSPDPARMQAFRQHEVVYLGTPEGARQHRDRWIEVGLDLLRGLGLEVEPVVANDPFFGRAGRMLAASQRAESLKIELVSPICSVEVPTAICSVNCHLDHFGHTFGIESADGQVAHTACVGFGVERVALALFKTFGFDTADWPDRTAGSLGL